MVEVFLDDNRVERARFETGTVGDAVRAVQQSCCTEDRIVVELRCDGLAVAANDMTSALRKPVDEVGRLELYTGLPSELVYTAMTQAAEALEQTDTQRQTTADLIAAGRTADAIEQLRQCIERLQQVHEAVVHSFPMLHITPDTLQVHGRSAEALFAGPRDLLAQVKAALIAQDYVLLADILQYEFGDVLREWEAVVAELMDVARAAGGGADDESGSDAEPT